MNEHDELERELAALRPAQPSPELKDRIAESLAEAGRGPGQGVGSLWRESITHDGKLLPAKDFRPLSIRRSLWLAALCGPLAACLALYLAWRGGNNPITDSEPPGLATQPLTAAAFDPDLPSVWSYRRALSQSADQLDALLDEHAQHAPNSTLKPQRAGAFVLTRSDSQLETLFGEL
jgi:hypothetical protein